ncbi:hypothetical protein ACTG9Q_23660 [Actinokineospora sp. 24-640]
MSEAPVRARLSRGVGLRAPLPDILGLAFRLPGPWDVLLSSTAGGVVPWFARSWRTGRFSSVVRYRLDGHRFQLRARVVDGCPDRLPVTFALSLGDGTPVARLVLDAAAPDEDTAFDPMLNRPGDLGMGPRWFARLRERAYDGSRTGRAGGDGRPATVCDASISACDPKEPSHG